MGRSCKLPFQLRDKIESLRFQKVHCDLWGPAPVASFQNMKYYVSFVDDCSRVTWIFPLYEGNLTFSLHS